MRDKENLPVVIAFHGEMITDFSIRRDPHQRSMNIHGAVDCKPGENLFENYQSDN